MVLSTRFLSISFVSKKRFLIFTLVVISYVYLCRPITYYYDEFDRSSPLILLFTYNYSIKTLANICQGVRNGGHVINFTKCPYKCEFSCRIEDFQVRSPRAVLFFGEDFSWPWKLTDQNRSSTQQQWIFWSWEAPIHHPEYTRSNLTFNWTMTYRQDSDIVHDYGRYVARNLSHTIRDHQAIDFYLSSNDNRSTYDIRQEFQSRRNEILWIVSNCHVRTRRHQTAQELSKYFPVDQYGKCSTANTSKSRMSAKEFEQTLFKYKFYLAFENAHCQDYVTEKVFYNALAHGSIPIVLGAKKENYKQLLPPDSFIYVDYSNNLTKLAAELDRISKDLSLFTLYHQWRNDYRLITWPSNYVIDNLFCELCIKLYKDRIPKSYGNFTNWLNKCM